MLHTLIFFLSFMSLTTTFAQQMVACDYDRITRRWLTFTSNSTFLEHDNDTIRLHCKRLTDFFHDEILEEDSLFDDVYLDEVDFVEEEEAEEEEAEADEEEAEADEEEEELTELDINSTAEF